MLRQGETTDETYLYLRYFSLYFSENAYQGERRLYPVGREVILKRMAETAKGK